MAAARRPGEGRRNSGRIQDRMRSSGAFESPHLRQASDPEMLEAQGRGAGPGIPRSTEHFVARDFGGLLGIAGLSDELLKNHFTLYQGYIKAANALLEGLDELVREGKGESPAYAGVKRRFGWEYNGIRLHELYFENLTKSPRPLDPGSSLFERIKQDFGGMENWGKDFRATGALRGIGWVVTYVDALRNKLFNAWIDEHDAGHLAGCAPILVMDVFEHAFMLDYGVKKADYVETFMKGIHWDTVAARLA